MAVQAKIFGDHFLVLFCVLFSSFSPIRAVQEFYGACDLTIDLLNTPNTYSGILIMEMPESFDAFQDPNRDRECDIILTFSHGSNLLIELYYVDIIPLSSDVMACNTGLEIFASNMQYYGGRICMEAWEWEERHRESKQEKHVVKDSPLTFRLVSSGPYKGQGFKVHFNQFRPYWPCFVREFKCEQVQRCVHDDLTCDGWNDCGDDSDEREDAGCDLLNASETN